MAGKVEAIETRVAGVEASSRWAEPRPSRGAMPANGRDAAGGGMPPMSPLPEDPVPPTGRGATQTAGGEAASNGMPPMPPLPEDTGRGVSTITHAGGEAAGVEAAAGGMTSSHGATPMLAAGDEAARGGVPPLPPLSEELRARSFSSGEEPASPEGSLRARARLNARALVGGSPGSPSSKKS